MSGLAPVLAFDRAAWMPNSQAKQRCPLCREMVELRYAHMVRGTRRYHATCGNRVREQRGLAPLSGLLHAHPSIRQPTP